MYVIESIDPNFGQNRLGKDENSCGSKLHKFKCYTTYEHVSSYCMLLKISLHYHLLSVLQSEGIQNLLRTLNLRNLA